MSRTRRATYPAFNNRKSATSSRAQVPMYPGTAQAGAAGTITLAADAPTSLPIPAFITTTGGTGSGQTRPVTAYDGGTKVATISPNWAVTPDNTTTYVVYDS